MSPILFVFLLSIAPLTKASADIVLDSASLTQVPGTLEIHVAKTFNFTLTSEQLSGSGIEADIPPFEDCFEVIVNGTSLILTEELPQFGSQDFVFKALRPVDTGSPWHINSNRRPRLIVASNSSHRQVRISKRRDNKKR